VVANQAHLVVAELELLKLQPKRRQMPEIVSKKDSHLDQVRHEVPKASHGGSDLMRII